MYTGPFTIQEECVHIIEFYSVDNLGNAEKVKVKVVRVDNSPPDTVSSIENPYYRDERGEWITSHTPISLNSTDYPECACGVREIHYSYDGGITWFATNSSKVEFLIPDECKHTVKWYAIDNLGNKEETKERTLMVDNSPPETTLILDGPFSGNGTEENPYRISSQTKMSLSVKDKPECGAVGVRDSFFRVWNEYIDTGWVSLKEAKDITIPEIIIEEGGLFYLEYFSEDLLGSREAAHKVVFYFQEPKQPLPQLQLFK